MDFCRASSTGQHCDCRDAVSSGICCYCLKKIKTPPPKLEFEDDGSEENIDA